MSLLSTRIEALALVAEDLSKVDALIRRRLDSDVALVRQVAEYLVAAGGKRLRPALLLLACGAAGLFRQIQQSGLRFPELRGRFGVRASKSLCRVDHLLIVGR